jgi:hypothetical protein
LTGYLRAKKQQCYLICAGDFNAHFGKLDLSISRSSFIGKILYHEESNENGEEIFQMCEMEELIVVSTLYDRSTKVTWARGDKMSQLDHILVPKQSDYKVMNLKAIWSKIPTDHKLIEWKMNFGQQISTSRNLLPRNDIYRVKSWDLKALNTPDNASRFEKIISELYAEERDKGRALTWSTVSSIVCYSAEKTIKLADRNLTDEQRKSYANLKETLQTVLSRRIVDLPHRADYDDHQPIPAPGAMELIRSAYKLVKRANSNQNHQHLQEFLTDVNANSATPGERVQKAFKFIKQSRRAQLCTSSVSIKDWDEDLKSLKGVSVQLLPESDHFPLLPPPSFEQIVAILSTMKIGRTPGLDKISVDFYKASPTLTRILHNFIVTKCYLANQVPQEFQQTLIIPIPKKKNPKTIDDHRKLTMCQIAYKVYAVILKQMVSHFIPSIDYYQNGFLPNRSCDDLCFTLKNVLDTRWNHDLPTNIFSLDMKKAFDNEDISTVPEILSNHQVPFFLINRIINSVLTETTQVQWKGQLTQPYAKSRGVKQGDPFSPEIFIFILDAAVQKTKIDLAALGIQLCTGSASENSLFLPLILGYADDVYIISEDMSIGIKVMEILLENLSKYGLELNPNKSSLLIKARNHLCSQLTSIKVLTYDIPIVNSLKVLGVTINSNMERKSAIKERVNNTMRVYKALLQFLKDLKAPLELLVRLYESIIVPAMLHGLSSSSMTEQNRKTLMRREILILKQLATIAHPRPTQISISKLLNNRTINRKVSANRIKYFMHVKRGGKDTLTTKSLNYTVSCKRKRGRPIYIFNQSLHHDISKYHALGIGEEDWENNFPFRETIKKMASLLLERDDLSDDPLPDYMNIYEDNEQQEN